MAFASHNHSVPESYLRGWSDDGVHVLARRLLVPADTYPNWEKKRVRSLTAYQHLYTSVQEGIPSDKMERWLNEEIESPAADAIDKVRRNARLLPKDFRRLAFYAASLDVRTPASYVEQMRRHEQTIPRVMENVLNGVRRDLERAAETGVPISPPSKPSPEDRLPLKVSIDRDAPDGPLIKTEVVLGRELWLYEMRRLLSGIAHILTNHRWHIVRPHPGYAWLTSDHPVLRLNFTSPTQYDFDGGWGRKGGEILLALSPEHLLYTRIGYPNSGLVQFPRVQTELVQRLLAERAPRWIIAHPERPRPQEDRQRRVDRTAFCAEVTAWHEWHESQSATSSDEDAA